MDNRVTGHRYQVVSRHEEKAYEILVRSDNIVQVNLTGAVYKRSDIDTVIGNIRKVTQSSTMLILVITSKKSRITADGIRMLFSKASTSYPVAKAYVISRPVHFMLAKLCLRNYKPRTPIKFFGDRAEAENWLLSLISC